MKRITEIMETVGLRRIRNFTEVDIDGQDNQIFQKGERW